MSRPQRNPAGWLWALGAAVLVMAARWREISLHGGEIPFLDQWRVEAGQILLPWLEGRLSPTDFFIPHNEHVPAWTRLCVWLEAVLLGKWDAQLQATLNAGLMGAFTGVLAAWLRRALPLLPALGLTILAVVLQSLPHSWENMVWGFQSTIPLALLFVFAHVHGSLAHPPGSAGWRWAQVAGIALLFTLGSMWAAALAVLLVLLWTGDWNRRRLLAAGLVTAAGMILLCLARGQQPPGGAAVLGATDLRQFIAALLVQLGWPSAWPVAAAVLNLPVFLLALRLRGQHSAAPVDRTVLALALWSAAQAVAFAYARGSYLGFVSRYSDLLSLGVLCNAVALYRVSQGSRWPSRLLLTGFVFGWGAVVVQGLNTINTQGHTLYFHEHSAPWAQVRRDAVRQYLGTKNPASLSRVEVRGVLYPDPAEVARALDNPRLVRLLPASVLPAGTEARGNFASAAARQMRESWAWWAGGGGLLLLVGAARSARDSPTAGRAGVLADGSLRAAGAAFALVALASGALLFLWPRPFEFRPERRWAPRLTPPGTVPDLSFHITTETNYPRDNLAGGAALWPEDFRNNFFGTHIDGPAFKGVAVSRAFPLTSPWYVVPFAGYPVSPGNALRLRIDDGTGRVLAELECPGPNPGPGPTDIGFWAVDVGRYAGQTGRLVISDGRDDAEGWVAAAAPQPATDGAAVAAAHRQAWAAEGTLRGLRSLQVIFATASLLAIVALATSARSPLNPTKPNRV